MESAELKDFKQKLEEQRQELIDEGEEKIPPSRVDPTANVDEDAQPHIEMNQVIASRRNKQRVLEIKRIDVALQRIREDPEEYGVCLECEEDIAKGRLEVMPSALYCVECQADRSNPRGHRRRHAGDFID